MLGTPLHGAEQTKYHRTAVSQRFRLALSCTPGLNDGSETVMLKAAHLPFSPSPDAQRLGERKLAGKHPEQSSMLKLALWSLAPGYRVTFPLFPSIHAVTLPAWHSISTCSICPPIDRVTK